MKICVFGAGAVGGHIAAKLAAAGNDVSVVARGAHLSAMQAKGLTLLHGSDTIRGKVRGSARASDLGRQDAVFVTLKANLLEVFADAAAPLLGPDTAVVFAQNGIPWWYGIALAPSRPKPPDLSRLDPGGKLKALVKAQNILGGVIYSANEIVEPGVIRNHVPGNNMLVIGEADDQQTNRIGTLRSLLEKAGMSSPATSDIRAAVWGKLTQNLGTSTLCLLTGGTVGDVRRDPEVDKLAKKAGDETRAIAKAHGIAIEAAPERPSGGHSSGMIGHKPSMLQDYERGRPLEVDSQLVMPLEFARVAAVAAPTLETLVPLCVYKATRRAPASPSPA